MARKQLEPEAEFYEWGENMNLMLYWTSWEFGSRPNGSPWRQARGLLWSLDPRKVLASIHVYNGHHSITVQCSEGLNDWTKAAVEKHLRRLKEHGWL